MAADDDFDDSDARPSASEANAELRRLATVRAHEARAFAEVEIRALIADVEALERRCIAVKINLNNWLDFIVNQNPEEK